MEMQALSPRDTAIAALHGGPISHTRRRILAAARALLSTDSYHSFSMEAVASRAGLSRRTLYNQFADRDALYGASRMALLQEFEHLLPPRDWSAATSLELFCREAVEALQTAAHRELLASVTRDATAVPWLADLYALRVEAPLQSAALRVLVECARRRGPGRHADPHAVAAGCVMLLRAAAGEDVAQPTLSAAELAGILNARLDAPGNARASEQAGDPSPAAQRPRTVLAVEPARRPVIKRGAVTITFEPTEVVWRGTRVALSPLAAELVALVARRGRVRWDELDAALEQHGGKSGCRDVIVYRIRRGFAAIGAANPLETVRGWGLRFISEGDDRGSRTVWIGASEPLAQPADARSAF